MELQANPAQASPGRGQCFPEGLAVAGASARRTLAGAARAGSASTRAVLFRLSATGLFRLTFVVFLHSSCSFFSFVSLRGYYHRLSKVQRLPTELTHVSVIHYSPSPGV